MSPLKQTVWSCKRHRNNDLRNIISHILLFAIFQNVKVKTPNSFLGKQTIKPFGRRENMLFKTKSIVTIRTNTKSQSNYKQCTCL